MLVKKTAAMPAMTMTTGSPPMMTKGRRGMHWQTKKKMTLSETTTELIQACDEF